MQDDDDDVEYLSSTSTESASSASEPGDVFISMSASGAVEAHGMWDGSSSGELEELEVCFERRTPG